MRVFLTGATGFIGTAVARELLAAGHKVLGVARTEAAAQRLADLGVEPHKADLTDLGSFVTGAQLCDGVIHCAFIIYYIIEEGLEILKNGIGYFFAIWSIMDLAVLTVSI